MKNDHVGCNNGESEDGCEFSGVVVGSIFSNCHLPHKKLIFSKMKLISFDGGDDDRVGDDAFIYTHESTAGIVHGHYRIHKRHSSFPLCRLSCLSQ